MRVRSEGTFPYVPRAFREKIKDKRLWPIFYFLTPDAKEGAKIIDSCGSFKMPTGKKARDGEGMIWVPEQGKSTNEILKKTLVGSKNYRDSKGKVIEFEQDERNNGVATYAFIDKIPPKLRAELANVGVDHITLSEEDLQGLEF